MTHNFLVMQFEHPILDTPEEYEEYHQIMMMLAEKAEKTTPDPQPQDFIFKKCEKEVDTTNNLTYA